MKSRSENRTFGTPHKEVSSEVMSSPHLARKERDDKKDLNHLRAIPMLNQDERRIG